MEDFVNKIYNIYELINNNNDSKTIINVKTISKQYLAYYIYRIISKYINLFNSALSGSTIDELFNLLRIPKEHNRLLTYPLAGKMTNDDQLLDMIILTGIDMFNKLNKYINSQTNKDSYQSLFSFLKEKKMPVIIQDLIDLQKLIPGLSVPAIRQNFISNSTIL